MLIKVNFYDTMAPVEYGQSVTKAALVNTDHIVDVRETTVARFGSIVEINLIDGRKMLTTSTIDDLLNTRVN